MPFFREISFSIPGYVPFLLWIIVLKLLLDFVIASLYSLLQHCLYLLV